MVRLRTLKPQLSTMPPRLGYVPDVEKARDRVRRETQERLGNYELKRWELLRQEILSRNGLRCQQTECSAPPRQQHRIAQSLTKSAPHRGDADLFWDPKNLQCVGKAYHDSEKQKQERRHK